MPIAAHVHDVDFSEEVERSYAEYSDEVITRRAIPDVRDGLKPSQRRILSMMYEDKFTPTSPFTKSARVVGDVMGRLHPHGDAAIYDAMVRMAQPHVTNVPLIEGQGNFGGPQASPAAARYTEARLSQAGMLMTEDLKANVVNMIPSDLEGNKGTDMEYEVLPTQFPALVVNGSSGIAVALSTEIPPHNFCEALRATLVQLDNQELWGEITRLRSEGEDYEEKLRELVSRILSVMPGPDFPTGGSIIGAREGVAEAFMTGRGKLVIEGKYRIQALKGGKHSITFYELPYGVNPDSIRGKITSAEREYRTSVKDNKKNPNVKVSGYVIDGLVGMDDFTDIDGINLNFIVDAKTNPKVVVAELLDKTALRSTYSYNMNAIVDGIPKQLGMPHLLQGFINARRDVIKRRSLNEMGKAKERLHLISGLVKAIADIDAVISIVRTSENQKEALKALKKTLAIDDTQAQYILDTPLKKLTKYDSLDLAQESETLTQAISQHEEVSSSPDKQREIIRRELSELVTWGEKQGFGKRRSEILGTSIQESNETHTAFLSAPREAPDEPVTLYVVNEKVYRSPRPYHARCQTTTLSDVLAVRRDGTAYKVGVPELAAGAHISGLVAIVPLDVPVVFGTRNGLIFAVEPNWPKHTEFTAMTLNDDEIVGAYPVTEGQYVFLSSDASVLTYDVSSVAVKATVGGKGMAGIRLAQGAHVVHFAMASPDAVVVTSTGQTMKATPLSQFPTKGRATGGVRGHRFLKGELEVTSGVIAPSPYIENVSVAEIAGKRDGSGHKVTGTIFQGKD